MGARETGSARDMGGGEERERGVLEGWEVGEMGRNYPTGLISVLQSNTGRESESLNALSLNLMSFCLTEWDSLFSLAS